MSRYLFVAVAAIAVLAGCTNNAPPPSPSASPTQSEQTAAPSATPTESPTPSPSAEPTPEWAIPSDWTEIDPKDAGVDSSTVEAVIGAWELPNGATASIVTVANESGTTNPDDLYNEWFADLSAGEDFEVQHDTVTTDAGEPVLTVRVTPVVETDGDPQDFILVLRPDTITWAKVADSNGGIDQSGDALWELMRLYPAE
jgi:hypothetical protein